MIAVAIEIPDSHRAYAVGAHPMPYVAERLRTL